MLVVRKWSCICADSIPAMALAGVACTLCTFLAKEACRRRWVLRQHDVNQRMVFRRQPGANWCEVQAYLGLAVSSWEECQPYGFLKLLNTNETMKTRPKVKQHFSLHCGTSLQWDILFYHHGWPWYHITLRRTKYFIAQRSFRLFFF